MPKWGLRNTWHGVRKILTPIHDKLGPSALHESRKTLTWKGFRDAQKAERWYTSMNSETRRRHAAGRQAMLRCEERSPLVITH
eukprot:2321101-Rhodomonas_salina.3